MMRILIDPLVFPPIAEQRSPRHNRSARRMASSSLTYVAFFMIALCVPIAAHAQRDFPAKPDGKGHNPHPAPAGHQEMAELMEGHQDSKNDKEPPGLLHQKPERIGGPCQRS